jgi:protein-tyrosine phosphatase
MPKRKILFVCSGNVFRSMSAEYLLKKHLIDNKINDWEVDSAGITAKTQEIDSKTTETLNKLGIKKINHKQKKLNKKMLKEYNVIISMGENHQEFIKKKYNYESLMFNEILYNQKIPILDIHEKVKDYKTNRKIVEKVIEDTINNISKDIPKLFEKISERYFLFEDFVSGNRTHRNGFPFIKLYETKNTCTFMSIDIPEKEDGHLLVIPKKRYAKLSHIPNNILTELITSVKKIGVVICEYHKGYNVLLNNGISAGQHILHVHFHIIPRDYGDSINIEVWKKKNRSINDFIKLNNLIKKRIDKISS